LLKTAQRLHRRHRSSSSPRNPLVIHSLLIKHHVTLSLALNHIPTLYILLATLKDDIETVGTIQDVPGGDGASKVSYGNPLSYSNHMPTLCAYTSVRAIVPASTQKRRRSLPFSRVPLDILTPRLNVTDPAIWKTVKGVSLKPRPPPLKLFDALWTHVEPRLLRLTVTSAGMYAYGEYTSGGIFKICCLLQLYAGLNSTDIVLDWGVGHLKTILGLFFFTGATGVGVEIDAPVYLGGCAVLKKARKMLRKRGISTPIAIMHGDSSKFSSFTPVTVVVQYDGGSSKEFSPVHEKITKTIFSTPTVRAVVSTKLNLARYRRYFPTAHHANSWRCLRVTDVSQGGSSYYTYIWLRRPWHLDRNRGTQPMDPKMKHMLESI
jgi:hypothetical protein